MKKLFSALIFCTALLLMSSFTANAQKVTATVSTDTLTNSDNASIVFTVPDGFDVAFQAVVTKLSGTAAGTVLLKGTIDGTNYVDVNTDTLTLTNVTTNSKLWAISNTSAPYIKYKLYFASTGTVSAVPKGYMVLRRKI